MRIIDERGRFFSKVNVIDFLVILFLLFFVPVFYFGYKIIFMKPVAIVLEKEKEAILKVKFTNLLPEITGVVKDGDEQIEVIEEMLDNKTIVSNKVVAKIEKIISNEPAEYINLKNDVTTWGFAKHPKNRDLVLEIKVLCKQKGNDLLFFSNNIPLKMNLRFNFYTGLYSISGTIIGIKIK